MNCTNCDELLEVAERYLEALDSEGCTCNTNFGVAGCPACTERELVEAAIAKAKGEDE